jgi:hypothetical protein
MRGWKCCELPLKNQVPCIAIAYTPATNYAAAPSLPALYAFDAPAMVFNNPDKSSVELLAG